MDEPRVYDQLLTLIVQNADRNGTRNISQGGTVNH
jgi:hypothetical protein